MHGVDAQPLVPNGNNMTTKLYAQDSESKRYQENAIKTEKYEHEERTKEIKAETEEYWHHLPGYADHDHMNSNNSEADSAEQNRRDFDTSSSNSLKSPSFERSRSFGSVEGMPFLQPLPSLEHLARSPVSSFHSSLVNAAAGLNAMKMPSGGFNHMKPRSHSTPDQNHRDVYYCHLCSFVGQNKADFDDHMSTHFEHQCPHCDYTSRTEGRLKRHIKDFHTDPDDPEGRREQSKPKTMRCRQCDFATQDKYEFWNHQRTHIKDDKMLQCPKCPFVTEYKHHLEYHLRNHYGSKPFKCDRCNYSCVNKSMLNSHMKSHTNVYQYRCADCTYATKYCHSLKLHLKKYNHNPATVLNPDGSLPTDGSGDFELVSKRGPPRGPRGPRKDKSPPPGFTPSMPSTPTQMPLMSGMMPGMWPMMQNMKGMLSGNGFMTPPGLLSIPGFPGMAQMYSAGFGSPMLPGFDSLSAIRDHQEMLRMFSSNAAMMDHRSPAHDQLRQLSAQIRQNDAQSDKSKMAARKPSPPNSPRVKQNVENSHKRAVAQNLAASIEAESQHNGECPLDLTKSNGHIFDRSDPVNDAAYGKRKLEECASSSDGEQEPTDGDTATPKKRSRKGKAFKLDAICLKLQENSSPADGDFESDTEMYGSEFDERSSPELDRVPMSTPAEKSKDQDPKVAFQQLAENLAVLNGTVAIQALNGHLKDESKDSGNEDHNSTDNSERLKISPNDSINLTLKKTVQVSRRLEPHFATKLGDISEEPTPIGQYECAHCAILFRDCVMYKEHMSFHGYQDPFKCNVCGDKSINSVEFFLHIARAAHN